MTLLLPCPSGWAEEMHEMSHDVMSDVVQYWGGCAGCGAWGASGACGK